MNMKSDSKYKYLFIFSSIFFLFIAILLYFNKWLEKEVSNINLSHHAIILRIFWLWGKNVFNSIFGANFQRLFV